MNRSKPLLEVWPVALPLRALHRANPSTSRVLHYGVWFRGHNNARYAELLPRLSRLDPYLFLCSQNRFVRGVELQGLRVLGDRQRTIVQRVVRGKYALMLSTDYRQAPFFEGSVVVDLDDPRFSPSEINALAHPNVVACVTTSKLAVGRYERLGLTKPFVVIPQGVALSTLDSDEVTRIRATSRSAGDFVAVFAAPFLRISRDETGDPMYGVGRLLQMWDDFAVRVPGARLWLIGRASDVVIKRCQGRPDVELLGYQSLGRTLAFMAAADVGLYPRPIDAGIASVKIAQYMAVGLPIVSYDVTPAQPVKEADAGIVVDSDREFVRALERMASDPNIRGRLAERARNAGKGLDWRLLAEKYERDVLDVYLR